MRWTPYACWPPGQQTLLLRTHGGPLSPRAQSQGDGSSDRAFIEHLCCARKKLESATVPFDLKIGRPFPWSQATWARIRQSLGRPGTVACRQGSVWHWAMAGASVMSGTLPGYTSRLSVLRRRCSFLRQQKPSLLKSLNSSVSALTGQAMHNGRRHMNPYQTWSSHGQPSK